MSSDKAFNEPKLALNRIYTRRGDAGDTSLVGGQRVAKDALRIECYGTVDELNANVGAACLSAQQSPNLANLAAILLRVQHELFNLGSILATLPQDVHSRQPQVTPADIVQLEAEIDEMNENLPTLRSFVLPGGCEINVILHQCRTICRRAERLAVALGRTEALPESAIGYLNRLSDALFVWSRWASVQLNAEEVLWEPNRSSSGQQ
ncbi:MAG: cob(I)yrinic acid a,c-diamide adenosyltransferase [Bryobacteraceae bacterium]